MTSLKLCGLQVGCLRIMTSRDVGAPVGFETNGKNRLSRQGREADFKLLMRCVRDCL
jgi:hypothetical protein